MDSTLIFIFIWTIARMCVGITNGSFAEICVSLIIACITLSMAIEQQNHNVKTIKCKSIPVLVLIILFIFNLFYFDLLSFCTSNKYNINAITYAQCVSNQGYIAVKFKDLSVDFKMANDVCNDEFNSELATIHSNEDRSQINDVLVAVGVTGGAWIGSSCNKTNDALCANFRYWQWLDGTPVDESIKYLIFGSGQTDEHSDFEKVDQQMAESYLRDGKRCMQFLPSSNGVVAGKPYTDHCNLDNKQAFVCNRNNDSLNGKTDMKCNVGEHKYYYTVSIQWSIGQLMDQFSSYFFVIMYLVLYQCKSKFKLIKNQNIHVYIIIMLHVVFLLKESWLSTWYVFRFANDDIYPFITMYFVNKVLNLLCFFYLILCWKRFELQRIAKLNTYNNDDDDLELLISTEENDDITQATPIIDKINLVSNPSNLSSTNPTNISDTKQNNNNQRATKQNDSQLSKITQTHSNTTYVSTDGPNTFSDSCRTASYKDRVLTASLTASVVSDNVTHNTDVSFKISNTVLQPSSINTASSVTSIDGILHPPSIVTSSRKTGDTPLMDGSTDTNFNTNQSVSSNPSCNNVYAEAANVHLSTTSVYHDPSPVHNEEKPLQPVQEQTFNDDDDFMRYDNLLQELPNAVKRINRSHGCSDNLFEQKMIAVECLMLVFLFLICVFYLFFMVTYLHVVYKYSVQEVTEWQRQYAESYNISWIVENFTNYHCKIIINLLFILVVLFNTLYNVIMQDYVKKYSLSYVELWQFTFGALHFSDARRFLFCFGVIVSTLPLSYSALTNYLILYCRDTYHFELLNHDIGWFMGLIMMTIFISIFIFIHMTFFQLRVNGNQNDTCTNRVNINQWYARILMIIAVSLVSLVVLLLGGIFDTKNLAINNAEWALIVGTYYWCWSDLYYIACDIFGATKENNSQAVRLFVFGIIAFINVTIFILGLYFHFWTQISFKSQHEYKVHAILILICSIVYGTISIIISIYFTKYGDINHGSDNKEQSRFYELFSAGLHLLCISPCSSNCNKLCCNCKCYTPQRQRIFNHTMNSCAEFVDFVCCDWLCKLTNTQNCTMRKSIETGFKAMLSFILITTSSVIFYLRFVGFYLLWRAFLFHCDVMTNQKTCQEIRNKMIQHIRTKK